MPHIAKKCARQWLRVVLPTTSNRMMIHFFTFNIMISEELRWYAENSTKAAMAWHDYHEIYVSHPKIHKSTRIEWFCAKGVASLFLNVNWNPSAHAEKKADTHQSMWSWMESAHARERQIDAEFKREETVNKNNILSVASFGLPTVMSWIIAVFRIFFSFSFFFPKIK